MALELTQAQRQFALYAAIGFASNLALYAVYILLTAAALRPVTAMTLTYVVGLLSTFLLNRHWTFAYPGSMRAALVRYLVVYALAYVINFLMLSYMVGQLGYPHQVVQAGLILFLAVAIFLAQRFWVFDERHEK